MKRSKLFLGVTTGLLAVAGLAASKAARFNPTATYGICTGTGTSQRCIATVHGLSTDSQKPVATVNGYTLYKFNPLGTTACGTGTSVKCVTNVTYPGQIVSE